MRWVVVFLCRIKEGIPFSQTERGSSREHFIKEKQIKCLIKLKTLNCSRSKLIMTELDHNFLKSS